MKHGYRLCFMGVVLLSMVLKGSPPAAQGLLGIDGTVLELKSGQPMQDVRISIAGPAIQSRFAITNAAGHFIFDGLPRGTYRILAEKSGFVLSRNSRIASHEPGLLVRLSQSQRVENFQLRMIPTSSITGIVLDSSGRPVPSWTVGLAQYTYDGDGIRRLISMPNLNVQTNDRGEYRFFGLPPGDFCVSFGGSLVAGYLWRRTFYPGTIDEDQASVVHVEPGEEVRLSNVVIHRERAVQLRLRFSLPPPSRPSNIMTQVEGIFFSSLSTDGHAEVLMPYVIPGHHEFLAVANYLTFGGPADHNTYYGRLSLNTAENDMEVEIPMMRAAPLATTVFLEDLQGVRRPVPLSPDPLGNETRVGCRLKPDPPSILNTPFPCAGPGVPPGTYRLEMTNLTADTYVESATVSGKDVLTTGINIAEDTKLEIVLRSPGATVEGVVRDVSGKGLADAIVALVPDAPKRDVSLLYRSTVSDIAGNFEIEGIAPGSYRLFAWQDLDGAAYRNSEFIKEYEAKGKPFQFGRGDHLDTDLSVAIRD